MGVLESPLTVTNNGDQEIEMKKEMPDVSESPASPLTMHTKWPHTKVTSPASRNSSPAKRPHKVSVCHNIRHCRSAAQKNGHAATAVASPKVGRYCTIYDVHRANIWLLRWLLRQMIINMPYYCCTGSLYYCQRTVKDLKRLLRLLLWAFWPDPRRLIVSRSQLRYFCYTTVAISYYLLRVQMRLVYHGGKGLSSTFTSAKSYRMARYWSKVLRKSLYGYRNHSSQAKELGLSLDDEESLEEHKDIIKQYNTRFSIYRVLPLKAMSRVWGSINSLDLPVFARAPAYKLYIWLYSCAMHEVECVDLQSYKNLSEFFRRSIRRELRPIDDASALTSPADGTVLHLGQVEDGRIEQVKGVTYSLKGFLDPDLTMVPSEDVMKLNDSEFARELLKDKDNELFYSVVYLSPGDYHRFHSPANWTTYMRRHFPGELFSVNPSIARWLQGLFNLNERAIYTGEWTYGFFSMAAVGATNVGSINVFFDKDLETNNGKEYAAGTYFDKKMHNGKSDGIDLDKGELLGDFNFGSTIVLIFEAPSGFEFKVEPGDKVKYGQSFGMFDGHEVKRRRIR